jgi:hypothetical protein
MVASRVIKNVPTTSNFDFLYGRFSLGKWKIPYFATTVGLQEAAGDLRLTSEIPGTEDIAWKIDELFQRDIDWPRVQRNILPYLRNTEVPQFFNSITIALLPFDIATGRLENDFGGEDWTPPELLNTQLYAKQLAVGPISLGFWDQWDSTDDEGFRSGRLAWNKNEVFGVAIDGQHRLAAIKELGESGGANAGLLESRVPVIFLVFDARVGYRNPSGHATVEVLRRIFIDLNKHAQTVRRGRQILLDDRDPHAVCVRRTIDEQLSPSADSLATNPPRLPLSLVDWHSEQAKFDDGPYLTTVLGLDWAVIECLGTKPITDWTDYGAVGRQLDRLQSRIGVDMTEARGRLAELENISMAPFVYTDEDLTTIGDAFVASWGRPLIKLLTHFDPYADLISMRISNGTLSLRFQQWFQLYQAKTREGANGGRATTEYQRFLARVGLDPDGPAGESDFTTPLRSIEAAKGDSLAFKVVFQKALIAGFLEYAKITNAHIEELESEYGEEEDFDFDDVDFDVDSTSLDAAIEEEAVGSPVDALGGVTVNEADARVDEYVRAMNRLVGEIPAVLEVEAEYADSDGPQLFWLGSLLKAEGGIDFTLSAVARTKDLLFAVAAMCLYDERTEPDQPSDFDAFWTETRDPNGIAVCRAVGRAIRRLSKDENTLGGRILKARGEDFDRDQAEQEVEERLRFVWTSLAL